MGRVHDSLACTCRDISRGATRVPLEARLTALQCGNRLVWSHRCGEQAPCSGIALFLATHQRLLSSLLESRQCHMLWPPSMGLLNRYWLSLVGEHCVCVPAAETFPIGALEGHTDAIWSVAFAPRGYTLADVPSVSHDAVMDDLPILVSASADRTIRVWSFNPADTGAKLGVDERACALASRGVLGRCWLKTCRWCVVVLKSRLFVVLLFVRTFVVVQGRRRRW